MIAICAIFKNEARYLFEWMSFHYIHGFDTFYLYNNESTDNYLDELNKVKSEFPKINLQLSRISNKGNSYNYQFNNSPQFRAYTHCLTKCKDERWCAFVDVDEFAYCNNSNIGEFLSQYEDKDIAGIGVNWILYGSNGHKKYSDENVISRFTRRSPDVNQHIKTIIRPSKCIFQIQSPHFFKPQAGFRIVNENKKTLSSSLSKANLISADKIRINHYFTKSEEEFNEKIKRGRADSSQKRTFREFNPHDQNTIEDLTALQIMQKNNRNIEKINRNIEVYTAICGKYDKKRNDIKTFIDKRSDKFKLPNLNAKIYKILSHKFTSKPYSIWIDGNIYLKTEPEQIIQEFLEDNDIVAFRHPERNCLYEEFTEARKRMQPIYQDLMNEQMVVYRNEGMPRGYGLSESGFIIRRNNDIVREFNEKWWAEICAYHNRDQMSFPYVWWKMKARIKIKLIEGNVRNHPYFKFDSHL